MDAYIIKAYRTAVGKAKKGSFKHTRADELAVKVVEHIMSEVPEIAPLSPKYRQAWGTSFWREAWRV